MRSHTLQMLRCKTKIWYKIENENMEVCFIHFVSKALFSAHVTEEMIQLPSKLSYRLSLIIITALSQEVWHIIHFYPLVAGINMIPVQLSRYPKNRKLRSEAIIFLNSSIYLRISSDKRSFYRTLYMYHSFTILTNFNNYFSISSLMFFKMYGVTTSTRTFASNIIFVILAYIIL